MKGADRATEMMRRLVSDATTALVYAALLDDLMNDDDLWDSFQGTIAGHSLSYIQQSLEESLVLALERIREKARVDRRSRRVTISIPGVLHELGPANLGIFDHSQQAQHAADFEQLANMHAEVIAELRDLRDEGFAHSLFNEARERKAEADLQAVLELASDTVDIVKAMEMDFRRGPSILELRRHRIAARSKAFWPFVRGTAGMSN